VAVLDYDRDGFMDLYFVNAGPLEGVTHHEKGTIREPNRFYRNRGDGTFEDVTAKAGVEGTVTVRRRWPGITTTTDGWISTW
jgi:enediyne biosynthesis protein E4